jgi:hypothetical protein
MMPAASEAGSSGRTSSEPGMTEPRTPSTSDSTTGMPAIAPSMGVRAWASKREGTTRRSKALSSRDTSPLQYGAKRSVPDEDRFGAGETVNDLGPCLSEHVPAFLLGEPTNPADHNVIRSKAELRPGVRALGQLDGNQSIWNDRCPDADPLQIFDRALTW